MNTSPINSLLSRRSVKFVEAPGPSDDELELILQAAVRAPDHGRLRPWRFAVIRGEAIDRLADRAIAEIKNSGEDYGGAKEATARRWLSKVPLMLAVACHIDPANTRIPESERLLSTAVAAGNVLNAAHMLGYAAFWSTGLGTYLEPVGRMLGFEAPDYRFLGYISIGTPIQEMPTTERPDYRNYVSEWTGL